MSCSNHKNELRQVIVLDLSFNSIIVYISCIIFLFLIGKIFIIPLKSIFKIICNSILGGLLIFIVNAIGSVWSFHIGLNIGTAIVTGILGVLRLYFINFFKIIYWLILLFFVLFFCTIFFIFFYILNIYLYRYF